MSQYPSAFETAIDHAMLYEVGGHWRRDAPGVEEGLINTREQQRAVGYVNDPLDRGGETKFGVAKNANPDLNITLLTWAGAQEVYFKMYWLAAKCDAVNQLSPRLAVLHFDGAINHGVGRASKFLQRAIRVTEDGSIGPGSLKALNTALFQIGELSLCGIICDIRQDFYSEIIQRNPSQERFRNGWMRRINEMRDYTTNPETVV